MGKIKRESDGRFTIDFIKTINKKRIHIFKKGFSSFDEAKRAVPLLLNKKTSPLFDCKNTFLFNRFFEKYLEHRSHKLGNTTLLSIKTLYNTFLKEYEDCYVSDVLSVHNTINIYKRITNRCNMCEKSKNRTLGELRSMVDYASFLKLISVEQASDNKVILENIPITKKSKEKECYNIHQLKRFLNCIDNEDDKDLFITYAYLGLRISEFVGLTWDCYDHKNKIIEIKQQILYMQKGKPVLTDKLKTKESYRKCKLNEETYKILEKRRQKQSIGYIFPKTASECETPLSKTSLRKKMIHYMNKAKLPIISPHGFRHTKATMFMSVCKTMADVKAAAKFMGHSVNMMMETYAHSEEKTIDILIKRLEE